MRDMDKKKRYITTQASYMEHERYSPKITKKITILCIFSINSWTDLGMTQFRLKLALHLSSTKNFDC